MGVGPNSQKAFPLGDGFLAGTKVDGDRWVTDEGYE